MNTWDKFISFFSARQELSRAQYRAAAQFVRKYEGASEGRRTKNWKAKSSSANTEISGSLAMLRNRSRQLVRDNPYANRGMQVVASNVVGWGIYSQVKVDAGQANSSGQNKLSEKRTFEMDKVWKAWTDTPAIDFEGRSDFCSLQRLVMRTIVESGEVLIRKRRVGRSKVMTAYGEVEVPPVQLQVLEGDYLNLNSILVEGAVPGNTVIQGIEFDSNGKRVAYHLFEDHPGNAFAGIGFSMQSKYKTVRVPASDVLHIYRLDRPGQIRGVPWLAPVMLRMKDFDEYEDAQLVRQKIAACFSVFIKDLDGVDATGGATSLAEKVEPGIIEILAPGKDISFANPPGVEGYGEYASHILHAIASGLGITYESLTGDFSQVNYSSGRMGFLEMSRNIEEWRHQIIIPQFLNPTFNWFLQGMDLLGYDTTRTRTVWTPPKREMVDPQKETEALKNQVRSGLISQMEAIRLGGEDPIKVFDEIAESNSLLDSKNIILDTDPRNDAKRIISPPPTTPAEQV